MNDTLETLRRVADAIGTSQIRRHILLCADQTNPKCCDKERSIALWNHLKMRLQERGLTRQGGIYRSKVNCLQICQYGPIAVVYPEGIWYHSLDEDAIDEIIEQHLVGGRPVRKHQFLEQPLHPDTPKETP